MEHKYEIGDIVRLINYKTATMMLDELKKFWKNEMLEYLGKTMTIQSISEVNGWYYMKEDEGKCLWPEILIKEKVEELENFDQNKIKKILNKWAEYTNFDEKKITFNLLSYDYYFHSKGKNIQKILKNYDNSGVLSILYAKYIFINYIKQTNVSLFTVLNDIKALQDERELFDLFTSSELKEIEKMYIHTIEKFIEKISEKKLIGSLDEQILLDTFCNKLDAVVSVLDECHIDIYQRGGKCKKILYYHTSILVFNTLAEALFFMSTANEGMYLIYISCYGTSDGYFGFFIKNNGNIFSINDRCDERYRGQHQNSRNGRWSDEHKDTIFPYDSLFSYSDRDYLGYAKIQEINKDSLFLFDLGIDIYMPLVLSMILLNKKYENKIPNEPLVYINSMMIPSLRNMIHNKNIMLPENINVLKNEIVCFNSQYKPSFIFDDVLNSNAGQLFEKKNNMYKKYDEVGDFKCYNQIFIDLFGKGFEEYYMKTHSSMNDSIKYIPLIENSYHIENNRQDQIEVEFVGTQARMDMEAYRSIRNELSDYIRIQMKQDYLQLGKRAGIKELYYTLLKGNINNIIELCIQRYIYHYQECDKMVIYTDDKTKIMKTMYFNTIPTMDNEKYPFNEIKERSYHLTYNCYIDSDRKATIFFAFKPEDAQDIVTLTGIPYEELPRLVRVWQKDGVKGYTGNSYLDSTDPINKMCSPFCYKEAISGFYDDIMDYKAPKGFTDDVFMNSHRVAELNFDFEFEIGFSKIEFNKLIRDYKSNQKILR